MTTCNSSFATSVLQIEMCLRLIICLGMEKLIEGTIWMNDPNSEDEDEREMVQVRLDNGFKVNFWLTGLTEEEYIKRANQIYELEKTEK